MRPRTAAAQRLQRATTTKANTALGINRRDTDAEPQEAPRCRSGVGRGRTRHLPQSITAAAQKLLKDRRRADGTCVATRMHGDATVNAFDSVAIGKRSGLKANRTKLLRIRVDSHTAAITQREAVVSRDSARIQHGPGSASVDGTAANASRWFLRRSVPYPS